MPPLTRATFLVFVANASIACQSPSKSITADPVPACSCAACPPAPSASIAGFSFDLPKAGSAPWIPAAPGASSAEAMGEVVFIALDAHGGVSVDGTPAHDDEALVAALSKHDPKSTRAIIGADASATHGSVIHLIDVMKRQGFASYAFAVSPPAPLH